MIRLITLSFSLLVAISIGPVTASAAAELIMVESKNCHWCHKWDADIGTTYNSTPVGQIAPLRRVDIADPKPDDLAHINLGRATPIFILMEDGTEVGRVYGYPGKATFWMLLQEQLAKLPSLQRESAPSEPKKTSYASSKNKSRWVRPLYSVR